MKRGFLHSFTFRALLIFAFGFGVGGTIAWFWGGAISIRDALESHLFWEEIGGSRSEIVERAYHRASPEVAIWVIQDYLREEDFRQAELPRRQYRSSYTMPFLGRLFLLAEQTGNEPLAQSVLDRAIQEAASSGARAFEKIKDEQSLRDFTNKWDETFSRERLDSSDDPLATEDSDSATTSTADSL